MSGTRDIERLQWQCRRGMLELDYILREFLDRCYPHLSEPLQRDFVRLLECPDPFLYDWLVGNSVPDDPALGQMVERVRTRDAR